MKEEHNAKQGFHNIYGIVNDIHFIIPGTRLQAD